MRKYNIVQDEQCFYKKHIYYNIRVFFKVVIFKYRIRDQQHNGLDSEKSHHNPEIIVHSLNNYIFFFNPPTVDS